MRRSRVRFGDGSARRAVFAALPSVTIAQKVDIENPDSYVVEENSTLLPSAIDRALTSFPSRLSPSPPSANSSLSSKAAGAAAALFLMASPAALADGLTIQYVPNGAPAKYTQPFIPDGRPVVTVEKDSSADISTEAARVAPNKQVGMKGCKTITGAPCEGASQVTMQ